MRKLIFALAVTLPLFAGAQKSISISEEMSPEAIHQQLDEQTSLLHEGEAPAPFTAEKYASGTIDLTNYAGKVVHLCFWGTWCRPCLNELQPEHLPAIIAPYLDNSDYIFLPIAQDTREALDTFFASERGKAYAWLAPLTGIDGTRSIFHLYASGGIPRSVIIGKDGKIAQTSIGSDAYELQLIAETLQKLLK